MKEEGYVSLRDAAKEIGYEKSPGKNPYEGINNEIIREINERVDTFFKRRRTGTEFIIKEIRRFLQKKEIPNKDIETYLKTLRLQIRSRQFDEVKDIIYGQGDLDIEIKHFISEGLGVENIISFLQHRPNTSVTTEEIFKLYNENKSKMDEFCKIFLQEFKDKISSTTPYSTIESSIRKFLEKEKNEKLANEFYTGRCEISYVQTGGITGNGVKILSNYLRKQYLKETGKKSPREFRYNMACNVAGYPTITGSTNYGREPDRVRDGNGEDKLIAYDDDEKGESSEVTKD